jgi:hypothetical protein
MDTPIRKLKTLLIFSLFICIYGAAEAQDYYGGGGGGWRRKPQNDQPQDKEDKGAVEPSGYMTINFGFANPNGDYAAAFGSGYGGYAEPGSDFNFSLAFPIQHSNFGVAFMFGSYANDYDINNYVNYLSNSSSIYGYGVIPGGNTVYSESSIMGGLYITYPVGRFSFDGRFMIGALLNSLPEQAYGKQDTAYNVTTYDLQTSYPTSLAFDGGIGIRCMIARFGRRQVCATVNLDYLYSNVSYNTEQVVDYTPAANNPNGYTYESDNSVSGHLNIQLLNITFGLGYQF